METRRGATWKTTLWSSVPWQDRSTATRTLDHRLGEGRPLHLCCTSFPVCRRGVRAKTRHPCTGLGPVRRWRRSTSKEGHASRSRAVGARVELGGRVCAVAWRGGTFRPPRRRAAGRPCAGRTGRWLLGPRQGSIVASTILAFRPPPACPPWPSLGCGRTPVARSAQDWRCPGVLGGCGTTNSASDGRRRPATAGNDQRSPVAVVASPKRCAFSHAASVPLRDTGCAAPGPGQAHRGPAARRLCFVHRSVGVSGRSMLAASHTGPLATTGRGRRGHACRCGLWPPGKRRCRRGSGAPFHPSRQPGNVVEGRHPRPPGTRCAPRLRGRTQSAPRPRRGGRETAAVHARYKDMYLGRYDVIVRRVALPD